MFEKSIEALALVKQDILETVQKNSKGSGSIESARNTIMFLDTVYMWLSQTKFLIEESSQEKVEAAAANVTPVDFTQKG